ncbi:MAG: hypothetical protein Q4P18_04650 [Methanobrevibacter sp.]|nr:hypothetical protein [Methanobrevibacter sp.]MDO5848802.1 hypothetical protein [Methanobrevibacter sp.]
MDEEKQIFCEMNVTSPTGFENIKQWGDEYKQLENDILSLEKSWIFC